MGIQRCREWLSLPRGSIRQKWWMFSDRKWHVQSAGQGLGTFAGGGTGSGSRVCYILHRKRKQCAPTSSGRRVVGWSRCFVSHPADMNPLTKVKLVRELSEREAGMVPPKVSWHSMYRDSAWVFVGGLPYELTEGDILCVFSQYGEIVNIHLVRDKKTGKSRGFGFICYEDQRSTVLAVDNFNGIKIKGRTIRVDHASNYRPPRDSEDVDDVTRELREKGCGPQVPSASSSGGCRNEALPPQPKLEKGKGEDQREDCSRSYGSEGQAMPRQRPDFQRERRPRNQ
ncbi:RNA-binding motif protein, X-linked 2 [Oryctolagus cuniculus]|uniref:RNA-binding motif protein, X-linked 2 n=1 Tax=Oryctolagus cuniculus TaxID=9986 RepID=UPI003879A6E0